MTEEQFANELLRLKKYQHWSWIALASFAIFSTSVLGGEAYFLHKAGHPEELTLRRLDIVDSRGMPRVILAAPLPPAMHFGKVGATDRRLSGILIGDATGTERGGYVTSDTDYSNAFLTLDAQGHQTVLLLAEPKGQTLFRIWDGDNDSLVMGVSGKNPFLNVMQKGKAALASPKDNPESTDPRPLFR
jgi:hypothetical protein